MPRLIPAWCRDVAALRAERAVVRASCARCGRAWVEDLEAVARFRGGGYSYIGRRAPCPNVSCGGTVFYLAIRPGAGTWPTHLTELGRNGV